MLVVDVFLPGALDTHTTAVSSIGTVYSIKVALSAVYPMAVSPTSDDPYPTLEEINRKIRKNDISYQSNNPIPYPSCLILRPPCLLSKEE